MIFNLFKSKPNWQHKDSNIRIAAINDELNIESKDEKLILLAMLNEDASEIVRRAVLLKLNSFDEFLNASINNDNVSVKEFSLLQVQNVLSNQHAISLSVDAKNEFLAKEIAKEKPNTTLLSHWLEKEVEPSIVLRVFNFLIQRKNPAQFILQTFTKKQSIEIQQMILALELPELKDSSLLNKLNKKSASQEITQQINERLAELLEQKEKPKRVLKQKQLLLSKLLALKEQSDYGQYLSVKTTLEQEWLEDISDLNCLSQEEHNLLVSKFEKIIDQLTQLFASKEEAFEQAKIAEQLLSDKKTASKNFSDTLNELEKKITTAVFEGDNANEELINQNEFSNQLNDLTRAISNSVLNSKEQISFLQKVSDLEVRLTQLPEIAESVSEATYLISKISQLSLPQHLNDLSERQEVYVDWLKQWKSVYKKAHGILPQSIINAHSEISTTWKVGLKPLEQEQKQLFSQTKKKLFDLKRLLASGKYKVCFGLFKGVSQSFALLSQSQQQHLQRDFENVSLKMAEISDWEHYIATPRKQELIIEINKLVSEPLDDPNAQANKVKEYRKTWNSLGHADESVDKELNEQFNVACEQAFAPCRIFYAEQEKLRSVHLETRNKILEDATKLTETVQSSSLENPSFDFKELDGKLNKIQQRWQQSGEIDRQQYQKLAKQFRATVQPVKNAIKQFHDANSTKKQALIVKAEQQFEVEDIFQAIEAVKVLQKEWREIGFAGSHQETKLWQKFRAINDKIFAKRSHVKSEQQAELSQIANDYEYKLAEIKSNLAESTPNNTDKTLLVNAKEQAHALLNSVITNKPVIKSVANAIELFIKETNAKIEQLQVEQDKIRWVNLFTLLEKAAQDDFLHTVDNLSDQTEFHSLSNFWQKRLSEYCLRTNSANVDSRAEKTLELEILAQVESPAELANQRMKVQVSLMQEQMQSSAKINLTQCLVDWLNLGRLEASDFTLIARLRNIFVS